MSFSFTVQELAQFDLLWNLVEDQGLQERFPALDKRDRRESGENYTFQHPVRTIGDRGLLPESSRTGARWPTVLRRRGLLPPRSS